MRILDVRRSVNARLAAAAVALLVLVAIVVVPCAQARPDKPAEPVPQANSQVEAELTTNVPHTISIRVIDRESGEPLPGATVEAHVYRLGYDVTRIEADDQGRCEITVPARMPDWISVAAHSDGFVPLEVSWEASELLADPPDEHTFALARGEEIGGVVHDEQGRPIAGARVVVWVRVPNTKEKTKVSTMRYPIETDASGRWRAACLPAGTAPDTEVFIRLEHPDFVSEPVGFSRRLTIEEARTMERIEVMPVGVDLKGRVIGPDGEPVVGARVALGLASDATMVPNPLLDITDAAGEFLIKHIKHEKDRSGGHRERLSAQAPGLAPEVQLVEIGPDAPAVEFRLREARPLRGRVVDPEGRPLAGAVVSVSSYHQSRALDWRVETDDEGRFAWLDGPAGGTVDLEAYKAPFLRVYRQMVPAGGENVEIVLHRPFRARGTVVDALTDEPVARFRLIPGTGPLPPGDRYIWDRHETREGAEGVFEEDNLFWLDQPVGKALMVEAEGYVPEVFDGFTIADESVEHAFRLRRAEPITGVVRDPEGRPLAGVQVELSFSPGDADFGYLNDRPPTDAEFVVTTDAGGRYSIKPREKPIGVVVRHERGFARLSPSELARSADVTLQPWSRIEGVYRVGDRPGANEDVQISVDTTTTESTSWVYQSHRTKTDAEGRFVIERAVPGFAVAFTPTVGPVSFEVRPGETARVSIGGSGRTVAGRIVTPGNTVLPFPLDKGTFARLVLDQPERPTPEGYAAMSQAERVAYFASWYHTPEGRAWKLAYQGNPIKVAADGSFRAVDVPPGNYTLEVRVSDPDSRERRDEERTEVSASVERKVVIPDGPVDVPIDLGTVELEVTTRHYDALAIGRKAPEIEGATTLDGKRLRLADFRGKYVLLDFWATWCGPCLEEEPHLKATYQSYKDDDRVVMIGLSLDDHVEAPEAHVKARGLDWAQGFLGGPGSDVTARFGVSSIPQTLLIGPDGTVLARDLRGARIRAAIAEALEKE